MRPVPALPTWLLLRFGPPDESFVGDLAGDRDAVGVVAGAEHRQHDHQLEVGQEAIGHFISHYEQIAGPVKAC